MFFKNCRAPIGSLKFLGSKEESMACALRRSGVTDSGTVNLLKAPFIVYHSRVIYQYEH
ncbi:MAG: hypothetical protein P8X74_19205 [Reinekea sp.]